MVNASQPQPLHAGIDEKDMLEIYLDVRKNGKLHVNPDLFNFTRGNLIAAIEKVYPGIKYTDRDFDKVMQLRNNVTRFAGYKTAWQVSDLLDQDDDVDAINALNKKYNTNYMRTEYVHTVRSTRAAKNWQNYTADADLYPYLEYIPSTAAEPRNEHKKLYGVIKPLDDPFWDTWMPPADWGCQCSVQQRRSDKGTTQPPEDIKLPPATMRNNPGKDGKVFTDKHPMISKVKDKTAATIEAKAQELSGNVIEAWTKFKAYDSNWEKVDFIIDNGGYIVQHNLHNTNSKGWKYEKIAVEILAQKGNRIELLNENLGYGVKAPDLKMNNKTWDVKAVFSYTSNSILESIWDGKKADKVIIFYTKNVDMKILHKGYARAKGRFDKLNKKMPEIYFIDNSNLIKFK